MKSKIIEDIQKKLPNERAEKTRYHITITDIAENKVVFDKNIKGIMGAVALNDERGHSFEIVCGNTNLRLNLLQQLENIADRVRARIFDIIGGGTHDQ
ncbi:MAG: hypothetical protein ACLRFR_02530 [Clostridia bacterium]